MSVHKSLVVNTALSRARNVFSRAERIEKLLETGRWKEGDSIFGLPKVKTRAKVRKVKKEKKVETVEGAVPAEGAAAAPEGAAAGKPDAKGAGAKAAGAKAAAGAKPEAKAAAKPAAKK
jgi:small basic protein (TIGR04137 family)